MKRQFFIYTFLILAPFGLLNATEGEEAGSPTTLAEARQQLATSTEELNREQCPAFNCYVDEKESNNSPTQFAKTSAQYKEEWRGLLVLNAEEGTDIAQTISNNEDLQTLDNTFDSYAAAELNDEFAGVFSELDLLKNQETRDKMKGAVAAAGAEAVGHGIRAALFHKQGKQLKDAIDDINQFNPEDVANPDDELLISQCEVEPNRPECAGLGTTARRGLNGFDISVGGNGQNQIIGNPTEGADLDTSGNGGNLAGRGNANKSGLSIGGSGGLSGGKGNGFEGGVRGAARVSTGAPIRGGGGGGGGGGASAPSNPGGRGGPSGPSATRGADSSKLGYGAGTSRLKYRGASLGGISNRKKTKGNPFKKLFGKSKELSFRNPASIGKKGSNLFQSISNRYGKVSKDKDRLLQYEKVK